MMRKFTIPVLCVLMLCACGEKKKETGKEVARMAHTQENNKVKVDTLRLRDFKKELVSNGKVAAQRKSELVFRNGGIIEKIYVGNGDRVSAGQVLAELENSSQRIAYNSALQNFEKAKMDLADALIGFGYDMADTASMDKTKLAIAKTRSGYNNSLLNLENARISLDNTVLRAPFAGKVANVKEFEYERISNAFCTVIDDSRMSVSFNVIEGEMGLVKAGQRVRISSFFNPEMSVIGVITNINPMVNDKGQVLVKAEFDNRSGFVDGMNVKVMAEHTVPAQLVVPKSAVVMRDNLEVLFRYKDGEAVWTYVHTLMSNSESYVVTANTERGADLSAGDVIITSGNLNLAHGSKVEIEQK